MSTQTNKPLTAKQVTALVKKWDDARAELATATDQVAAIRLQIEELDDTATDERKAELNTLLEGAQTRQTAANTVISELQPLPEGAKLPPAKAKTEIPAGVHTGGSQQAATPGQTNAAGPGGESTKRAPAQSDAVARASGTTAITVIGPAKGRRRAGFNFNSVARTVWVTPEQKLEIESDPGLAVTEGEMPTASEVAELRTVLSIDDFEFAKGRAAIKVLGPAKGRRRAGHLFNAVAQTVEVTKDELLAILADTSLGVSQA